MGETIKVDVLVTDNGSTAQATNNAKALNTELQKVQRTAAQTSAALKSAAAARPSGAMSQAQDDDIASYRTARGIGGSTGAEGRDFARQAQGLGGLVHVYATFAANLFAVSAAFNALSKAADTTNMVKGLDQLGAASGRALGSMAQNITKITDGAISLRSAMQATAQATAGGLSGQQFERLTKVAQKASQALGRDMEDALSRLTRGVVKIEPELLDELGIMTRVDAATREYARTLGKTATSLTDFEKRQAFAIAAIEEGERKFSSIQLDATPYQKLLASFSNLAIKGGELLNTVLGPLVKLLAESPTALGLAIASISAMLLNKAIPAIGQWKKGLEEAAAVAATTAKKKFEEFDTARRNAAKSMIAEAEKTAEGQVAAVDRAAARLELAATQAQSKFSKGTKSYEIINKPIQEISDKDIAFLEKRSNIETKRGRLEVAQAYKDSVLAIKESIAAENAYRAVVEKTSLALQAKAGALTNQARLERELIAAQQKAATVSILQQMSKTTDVMGPIAGLKQLRDSISYAMNPVGPAIESMSKFAAVTTLVKGGAIAAAGGIKILYSAVTSLLGIIAVVFAAFSIFDAVMSKSSKQAEELDNSLETLNSSADNISRTLDNINSKDFLGQISAESLQARANAFNEMSNSLGASIDKFSKFNAASGWWDKTKDWVKDIFNSSNADKLATAMATSINKSLLLLKNSDTKKKLEEELKLKVGADPKNIEEFDNALEKLAKDNPARLDEINKVLQDINREINNQASAASALVESIKASAKEFDNLLTSLNPTDKLSKLGMAQLKVAQDLNKALTISTEGLNRLATISNDWEQIKGLPPEFAASLVSAQPKLKELAENFNTTGVAIEAYTNRLEELKATNEEYNPTDGSTILINQDEINYFEKLIANYNTQRKQLEPEIKSLVDYFRFKLSEAFTESAAIITKGVDQALAKAGIGVQQHMLSLVGSVPGGTGMASAEADLARQDLAIQAEQIKASINLVVSQEKLKLAIERNTLAQEAALLESKKNSISADEYRNKSTSINKSLSENEAASSLMTSMQKNGLVSTTKALKELMTDTNLEAAGIQGRMMGLFVATQGATQQMASLNAEYKKISLTEDFKIREEIYQKTKQNNDLEIQKLTTQSKQLDLLAQISPAIAAEVLQQKNLVDRAAEKLALETQYARILQLSAERQAILNSNAPKKQLDAMLSANEAKIRKEVADYENSAANNRTAAAKAVLDILKAQHDVAKDLNTLSMELFKLDSKIAEIELQKKENSLETANELYRLDKSIYAEAKASLAYEKAALTYKLKIEEEATRFANEQLSFALKRAELELKISELKNADPKDIEKLRDILNEQQEQLNKKHAKTIESIERENELTLQTIANTKEVATYTATWKPFIDGIGSALEEGLKVGLEKGALEGGKTFIQVLKDQLKKAVFNITINTLINPMMNSLTGAVTGGQGNGMGLLQKGVNAYNNYDALTTPGGMYAGYSDFAHSSMGRALGLSETTSSVTNGVSTFGGEGAQTLVNEAGEVVAFNPDIVSTGDTLTGLGQTGADTIGNMSQAEFGGYLSAIFAASQGNYGQAAGTAIGTYLGNTVFASFGGSFWGPILGGLLGGLLDGGGGGPKKEGNFRAGFDDTGNLQDIGAFLGSTDGRENNLEHSETKTVRNLLRGSMMGAQALAGAYGGTITGLSSDLFFNTDPEGTAPDNVAGSVRDKNGNIIYKRIADVDKGKGGKELEGEAKRVILAMLKETDLVPAMNEYLDGLNISELSNDAASAALDLVSNFTSVIASLKMLGKTGEDITVSFKDMTKEQTEAFNTSMSHFNMLAWALGPTSERVTSLADSLTTTGATLADFTTGVDNLFNEFLKGYDTSKMTTEELSSLIVTLKQTKDAINFVNKSLSGTLGLPKTLSDAAGGLDKLKEQVASYYELFFTDQEKSTNNFKSLSKEFDALNIKMPTSKEGFRNLVEGLDLTTDSGQATFTALMRLAPAFAAVADATQNIIDTVAQVRTRIAEMRFNMEYDTKDNAGKYAMLDDRADLLNKKMRSSTDIFEQASLANQLLDNINTAFALLNDDQKKAALPEYLDKLNSIDTFIQEQGIQALSELTPDGVRTVEAIQDSTAAIVEAITESDPTIILDKYFNSTNSSVQAALEKSPAAMADALDFAITNLLETTDTTGVMSQADIDAISGKLTDSISAKQAAAAATAGTEDDVAVTAEIQAITSAVTAMQGAMETINAAQASLDAALNAPATLQDGSLTPEAIQADIAAKTAQANEISAKQTEAQTQATEAITGLANNTLSLEQVINTLQTLATTLVAAAKTPVRVDVDVNVDTPATAEVGIG